MNEEPSADRILEMLNAYQRTDALRTAIELDWFTAVARGFDTPRALAEERSVDPRAARILSDGLVVAGLLHKEGTRYFLTDEAARFLDRASPDFLGDSARFVAGGTLRRGFSRLTAAVRRGGTALDDEGVLAEDHEAWVTFARTMAPRMMAPAVALADLLLAEKEAPRSVLDVAAGHGMFGIEVARRDPGTRLTALDWPAVLAVAAENAEAAGLGDRFERRSGSALDVDPGRDHDLVLACNFLHHLDPDTCVAALGRLRESLRDGGRLAAVEHVPAEDRVSPPRAAHFALVMLATTPGGDAYTFEEYRKMFSRAGFPGLRQCALPGSEQRALIAER